MYHLYNDMYDPIYFIDENGWWILNLIQLYISGENKKKKVNQSGGNFTQK